MAVNEMLSRKETGKKNKVKAVRVPEKRTMNFVRHEKKFHAQVMIPLLLILVLATGAFVKYGVIDQIAMRTEAYQQLSQKLDHLGEINEGLADYREVETAYNRYSEALLKNEEVDLLDRIQVLDLVEERIAPRAVILNLAVNGNVLSMNLKGLTLEQASKMVKEIELSPLVYSAAVYQAVAEDAEEASIFMSIILTKEAEDHE